jgi:thioredoxin:protein disulfide reductase
MRMSRVFALAALAAVGLAIIPEVLPTGTGANLDASDMLSSGRFFVAAGIIFLGGLLTSLTPCVYPLIPITVGVFGARQADSRLRATLLTTAYVFGMGLVFAGLGVFAAASGKAFGAMLGSPWVAGGLAVFMLVLASSMFGAFELALPTGLATRLNGVGGAGLLGALLMGSVAGFLAAPCTGPVLSGVLTWVATTQNMALGGGLLFIYAMGIGVPFFLIGVFTVRLPKGGEWMEWIKSVFGVALVALAATYIRDAAPSLRAPLIDAAATLEGAPLIAVTSTLALIGVLLGAIHLSFKEGAGKAALKAAGVLALVAGLLLRTAPAPESHDWTLVDIAKAESLAPFETALAQAKASGRPVVIDFFAEWCAACKELDKFTYVAPEVKGELGRFAMVKVDGTNDHNLLNKLYDKFGVNGLPTVAFVDSTGVVLSDPKITGFLEAEKFVTELKKVR